MPRTSRPRHNCRLRDPHLTWLREQALALGSTPTPAQINDVLDALEIQFAQFFAKIEPGEEQEHLRGTARKTLANMCDPFRNSKGNIRADEWLTARLRALRAAQSRSNERDPPPRDPYGPLFLEMQAMGFTATKPSFCDWVRAWRDPGLGPVESGAAGGAGGAGGARMLIPALAALVEAYASSCEEQSEEESAGPLQVTSEQQSVDTLRSTGMWAAAAAFVQQDAAGGGGAAAGGGIAAPHAPVRTPSPSWSLPFTGMRHDDRSSSNSAASDCSALR